jgi:hypothetical protein
LAECTQQNDADHCHGMSDEDGSTVPLATAKGDFGDFAIFAVVADEVIAVAFMTIGGSSAQTMLGTDFDEEAQRLEKHWLAMVMGEANVRVGASFTAEGQRSRERRIAFRKW